ncbi:ComEC/Rec2 family competence protein [Demequina salsinemoris]|uniref:ComEC/Rec2 family competence protein n=1 Tax=Demequina salsinemoris TaxID=577470 RepID=UPI0007830204|nr:ComEC/Rec2 family competence protein [Demequina salsinemoris]
MTARHDLRLVPAALAAWGCAMLVATGQAGAGWAVAAGLGVIAAGVALRAPRAAPMVAVPVVAGAAVLLVGGARLAREEPLVALVEQGDVTLTAVVAADPEPTRADTFTGEPRLRVDLDSVSVATGGAATPTAGRVVAIVDDAWAELVVGDTVTLVAQLDDAGVGRAVALVWGGDLVSVHPPAGAAALVAQSRASFRTATAGLDDEVRGLVRGMVIGDDSAIPDEQRADLREVSLTHLTAVSGAHLAIIAGLLGAALRALPIGRRARLLGLLAGMSAFAMLVLPQPSVARSLAMACVGAVGGLWGRPAQAMPALATSVIVLVAWDPYLAIEYGMALSVSAVTGIVLLAPALRRALTRPLGGLAAMAVSIPAAAQLACMPVLVLLSPSLPSWAVAANLAAVPFAAPIVTLGAIGVIASSLALTGASVLAALLGMLALPIARIARLLAGAPGASLPWPAGGEGVACAVALLVCVAVAAGSGPPSLRWAGAVGGLAVLVASVRTASALLVADVPDAWRIASCDVGQGDMTVVRAGEDSAVVVDTGPGGGAGECLASLGVERVPLLILTHPHADHDGAIDEVASVAGVDAVWWSSAALGEAGASAGADLDALGISPTVPDAGTTASVGEATVLVLPTDGTAGHAPAQADDGSAVNDESLALLIESGGLSIVVLGDLEADAQAELADAIEPLELTAVKVAHHGSASQDLGLADDLHAAVALVSVGEDNTYGHPAASALALYEAAGAATFRTDECGTIVLSPDDGLTVASRCPTVVAG